jgi:hypothetical protein
MPRAPVRAAPAPVPRQLPADTSCFTGRTAELGQINGVLVEMAALPYEYTIG